MAKAGARFVWYELATTDIETAKAFYADVVGWDTGDAPMPGSVYTQFTAGGTPVAGLMKLTGGERRNGPAPQWVGFVGVDDVDVAACRVQQLGGSVHVPPTNVPNITRFSVVADPHMVPLALVKGPERGSETTMRPGAPGHVGWHELQLHVSDLERSFAFYSELLGWQKVDIQTGSMGTYLQFGAGTKTIGGMFAGPERSALSLWLFHFNVGDIEAAAKRVETGGGQIIYGPAAVPGGARVVHCRDPQGAVFALIDWRIHFAVGCYSPRVPSARSDRK
jgi:uncharacterized protein